MPTPTDTVTPTPSNETLENGLSAWDEVRRMAEEIELQVHLASMNARDRWRAIEPRLAALENKITRTGERVGEAIANELKAVGSLVRTLRDEIAKKN